VVATAPPFDIEAEARKMKLNMGANDNKEASKSMLKCLLQVGLEQHNVN
jgi:hypothetical protein